MNSNQFDPAFKAFQNLVQCFDYKVYKKILSFKSVGFNNAQAIRWNKVNEIDCFD